MVTLRVELPGGERTIECESGDILRDVLLAEKVSVYFCGALLVRRHEVPGTVLANDRLHGYISGPALTASKFCFFATASQDPSVSQCAG